jgi:hypothetical protein
VEIISPHPKDVLYQLCRDFRFDFSFGGDSGDVYRITIQRTYGALLFRYDLKLSFCQVDKFAVALIINFSFQGALFFFLN